MERSRADREDAERRLRQEHGGGDFSGHKPSAGHDVEIVGVRTQEKDLIVEYVQKQPGRGTMAAQILTEPYHLVAVPKHAGTVRFIHVPDTSK